jgi:hypothetical protein
MSNLKKKISDLVAAITGGGVDIMPIMQGGVTKQLPLSKLPISDAVAAALGNKADATALAAKADVAAVNARVLISAIVNDLTTGGASVPLSAEQGKALKALIDAMPGGSGGGDPIATTFAVSIPLDKPQGREMGQVMQGGALTLTPNTATAVVDGNCNVSIMRDGTNALDISAFTKASSFTLAANSGDICELTFFARPNGRYYVGYIYGGNIDIVAPTILSAIVNAATPDRITVTMSEAINATMPATTAFAVSSGHSITAINRIDATHFELVLNANFVAGESAKTLGYTQPGTNPIKDLATVPNLMASVAGIAITNNAAALPTITGAVVQNAAPTVVELTLSENYTGALPAASAFAVNPHIVSSVSAGSAGNKINLTLSVGFTAGETRTLDYTKPGTNPITGFTSHQQLASITGVAITNNVAGSSYGRFTPGAAVVESGNSTTGWGYTSTTAGGGLFPFHPGQAAQSQFSLPAGPGSVRFTISDLVGSGSDTWCVYAQLQSNNTDTVDIDDGAGAYSKHTEWEMAVHYDGSAFTYSEPFTTGSLGGTAAIGDMIEFQRFSDNSVRCSVSRDGGTTWSTLHAFPTALVGQAWMLLQLSTAGTVSNFQSS